MSAELFHDEQITYQDEHLILTNRRLLVGESEYLLSDISVVEVQPTRKYHFAGMLVALLASMAVLVVSLASNFSTAVLVLGVLSIFAMTIMGTHLLDPHILVITTSQGVYPILEHKDTDYLDKIGKLITQPRAECVSSPAIAADGIVVQPSPVSRFESPIRIPDLRLPDGSLGETTHYTTPTIKVTATRVIVGETTYAVSQITSVAIKPDEQARRGILIVGSCISAPVVLGVAASTTAPIIWVLTFFGVVAFTVCLMSANQSKALWIATAAGEVQAVSGVEEKQLQEIAAAINAAIAARG